MKSGILGDEESDLVKKVLTVIKAHEDKESFKLKKEAMKDYKECLKKQKELVEAEAWRVRTTQQSDDHSKLFCKNFLLNFFCSYSINFYFLKNSVW